MPGNIDSIMNGKKFFLPTALVASAVLLALAGWWWLGDDGDGAQVKYRLTKVERGTIVSTVAASGTLNAVKTIAVSSQISGQLKDVLVDFNSNVKPGQVLARIDPESYQLRISQARADLDAARSAALVQQNSVAGQRIELGKAKIALADADRDLQRKKDLVGKGFISTSELDKGAAEQCGRPTYRAWQGEDRTGRCRS